MNNLGVKYEEIAVNYLIKKGYKILERNFRNKLGEIDIVAMDKKCIVFIEVKGGKDYLGSPGERAGLNKMRKIEKVGEYYLYKNQNIDFEEVRIDVISVNNNNQIEHFYSLRE